MKKVKPDDYFNNGIFEIARFGRHTILKNNMSTKEHTEYEQYLKSEYPKQILKINSEIKKIREEILKCDPLQLLSFSADNTLMGFINLFSESEISNNYINRSTEYIQSILVSSPQTKIETEDTDPSEKFYQIINEIDNLHSMIRQFYFSFAANIKELYPDINDSTIELMIEAQLMYLVRGHRYQIFELEYYENLLTEHNDIFLELFNTSSKDIINGIKKLQYSLTQGKFDAFNSLYRCFEDYQSGNKTIEEFSHEKKTEHYDIIDKCLGSKLRNVYEVTG